MEQDNAAVEVTANEKKAETTGAETPVSQPPQTENTEHVVGNDMVSPAFCIQEDERIPVEVDVLTDPRTGHVVSVSKTGYGIDFAKDFSQFTHTVLRFYFTTPSYFQLSNYRRRSLRTDDDGNTVIDKLQMREYFVINHLKGWNLPDGRGGIVPYEFDKNNVISEQTLKCIHSLAPSILEVVLTAYEKDVLLL